MKPTGTRLGSWTSRRSGTRWLDNRLPIETVNGGSRAVTFDRPSLFALVASAPWGDSTLTPSVYWVENVFEAMDTPGQWYLDRPQGRLYHLPRPGEDMTAAEIIAPRLLRVVQVVGRPSAPAHDLRFEGITYSHTEWQPPADYASSLQAGIEVPGALWFDYAERCAVTGGGIEHIGNFGVEVGVGCADLEISHNRITDIGAGGIRIGHFFSWETDGTGQLTERGQQRKAAMPTGPHSQRIIVAHNVIAHCGRFTPEAMGVFVGDNARNQIIHNHIYDLFQSAIAVGSVQDFEPSQARGNIIYYREGLAIGRSGIENSGTNVCMFDRNLYWNTSGQPVIFGDKTFAQWQATGQDKDGLVADPLFVDPRHGEFTLQPGSPAEKIGFQPWDVKAVGPRPSVSRSGMKE